MLQAGPQGSPSAFEPWWEWNGSDVTQFEGAQVFGGGGSSNQTLSVSRVVDATREKGGFLRFTGASPGGTTGTRAAVLLAVQPLPSLSDLLVELEVITVPNNYFGVSVYGDISGGAGHYFGYNYVFGAAGWRSRVDDSVLNSSGTTTNNSLTVATPGLVQITIRGGKVPGAQPKFHLHGRGLQVLGDGGAGAYLRNGDWNGEPAPAGWNNLACLRWGVAVQAGGGATLPTVDIADMRVYRLR